MKPLVGIRLISEGRQNEQCSRGRARRTHDEWQVFLVVTSAQTRSVHTALQIRRNPPGEIRLPARILEVIVVQVDRVVVGRTREEMTRAAIPMRPGHRAHGIVDEGGIEPVAAAIGYGRTIRPRRQIPLREQAFGGRRSPRESAASSSTSRMRPIERGARELAVEAGADAIRFFGMQRADQQIRFAIAMPATLWRTQWHARGSSRCAARTARRRCQSIASPESRVVLDDHEMPGGVEALRRFHASLAELQNQLSAFADRKIHSVARSGTPTEDPLSPAPDPRGQNPDRECETGDVQRIPMRNAQVRPGVQPLHAPG